MKTDKQNQRNDQWQKHVDEYISSGMTQKAFCEQHNLNLGQFGYYHGKFKSNKELVISKASFSPVKIINHEKIIPESDIKLSIPNGFQCVFSSNVDMIKIKQLVEVLLSC